MFFLVFLFLFFIASLFQDDPREVDAYFGLLEGQPMHETWLALTKPEDREQLSVKLSYLSSQAGAKANTHGNKLYGAVQKARVTGWRAKAAQMWRERMGKRSLAVRLKYVCPKGGKAGKKKTKKKMNKKVKQVSTGKLEQQKLKQAAVQEQLKDDKEKELHGKLVGKNARLVYNSSRTPGRSLLINTRWQVVRQKPNGGQLLLKNAANHERWEDLADVYVLTGTEKAPLASYVLDLRAVRADHKEKALTACGNELKAGPVPYKMLESAEMMAIWHEVLFRAEQADRPLLVC